MLIITLSRSCSQFPENQKSNLNALNRTHYPINARQSLISPNLADSEDSNFFFDPVVSIGAFLIFLVHLFIESDSMTIESDRTW